MTTPGSHALGSGDRDANPRGIGLCALIAEDFATHGHDPLAPGFVALAVHRFGNWRMGVRSKGLRVPLTVLYRAAFHGVVALWGIDLPYNVKVGRRLRIVHHGCIMGGASAIGDDVVIRHAVTIGVRQRGALEFPVIGDRVELGPGACVVGGIRIGADSVIGANTVVGFDVPQGSLVFGMPARRYSVHPVLGRADRQLVNPPSTTNV
jgi:serine O-acetyltransferase